ncbi:hypothetical protein PFICI_04512 [Pestalotiopsis fici W106-1]|uniref:SET domain-containing protein n=1 Tax=Pestalotiopsis fici (strain W106-1 / CGMCC3.15140) TaxID=1229662 RepID=W3XBT2_PESFW|nr:uncharacterized protein PFICI_04512 [Pestalotiopsis fici W106-1]ETS82636.1 hypothetical protein PFICI_04512 [Pestalotiopsis fici W106-1]
MTEKLQSLSTQIVPPSQTTVLSPKAALDLSQHVPSKVETVEEEPYTIKCICNFADDDGSTIYCEPCDTWQHIECYYPTTSQAALQADFAHLCVDCKPRPLDRQGADERQRLRRVNIHSTEDPSERKIKRPPAKSHKKKSKPDLQINGHNGPEPNTKQSTEPHGHKKSKTSHRPSQSISSTTKRSPSYGQKNGNTHAHPPSPATTPPDIPADSEIHHYSDSFLALYNDDRDIQLVQTNSFASLEISNVMSLWTRDHEKLRRDCGCEYKDVFQPLPSDIDVIKRTPVVSHKKQMSTPDTVLHWQYLTTPSSIEKDTPLVELNGQLGYQKDYCSDEGNQWDLLSSPLPFVFFHPELPLYIDTRREGSLARYVRRSCRPNATLETYLSSGSEYHFWLVSDRRIAPNEQITIAWDFRLERGERGRRTLQLLGLGDENLAEQPEYDPNSVDDYQGIHVWLFQILSEHGGCACDLGSDCAFVRFYKKYINRSYSKSGVKKKSRKPKTHAISPTTTTSRAASEGHGDDGAENDSGSSRSKPPSRDMTPARQGSFDTLGILTEPTDRDKRKVAMVEDSFRRMEQQQPPRKKKRTSDGPNPTTKPKRNSTSNASNQMGGTTERRYVDAGTNRSMSGSPQSANLLKQSTPRQGSVSIPSRHSSEGPRPAYRDAAVQTDPVVGEWFSQVQQTPKTKRRVVSLSKRLLDNRHRIKVDCEERRRLSTASPTSVASALVKMDIDSPTDRSSRLLSPVATKEQPQVDQGGDAMMTDATLVSPTDTRAFSPIETLASRQVKPNSPELRVQLPPVPGFNGALAIAASPTTTPMSAAGSLASPFGPGPAAVNGLSSNPSPVKKKLSLSDYKSRMNKGMAGKPASSTSLKTPTAIIEEAKSPVSVDVHMSDLPVAEKTTEL